MDMGFIRVAPEVLHSGDTAVNRSAEKQKFAPQARMAKRVRRTKLTFRHTFDVQNSPPELIS